MISQSSPSIVMLVMMLFALSMLVVLVPVDGYRYPVGAHRPEFSRLVGFVSAVSGSDSGYCFGIEAADETSTLHFSPNSLHTKHNIISRKYGGMEVLYILSYCTPAVEYYGI